MAIRPKSRYTYTQDKCITDFGLYQWGTDFRLGTTRHKQGKCLHPCLHSACTRILGNRQVLAPVPALMGSMLSPMPALVGIMLAPCSHFCLSAVFPSGRYTVTECRLFSSVGKKNKATGTDATRGMTNVCLDKPSAESSESPRVFGLTKTLGGYHYRQSRNDNRTPLRAYQPKGKSET